MTHPNPSDSRQERITELEQKISRLEHKHDQMAGVTAGVDRGTIECEIDKLRSELSRLRNESGGGAEPKRKDGGKPCGECHLKPGETCDICGAVEPVAWRNKPPIESEPWTITTDLEMVERRRADGWLVEPSTAPAQSDERPVAWKWRWEGRESWLYTDDKAVVDALLRDSFYEVRPLADLLPIAMPPQSDERAGLERAAEWNAKAIIALEAIAKLQGAAIELGPAIASGFFEARSLAQGDRSNG